MDLLGLNKLISDFPACCLSCPASSQPGNTKMDLLGLNKSSLEPCLILTPNLTERQPQLGIMQAGWLECLSTFLF